MPQRAVEPWVLVAHPRIADSDPRQTHGVIAGSHEWVPSMGVRGRNADIMAHTDLLYVATEVNLSVQE